MTTSIYEGSSINPTDIVVGALNVHNLAVDVLDCSNSLVTLPGINRTPQGGKFG